MTNNLIEEQALWEMQATYSPITHIVSLLYSNTTASVITRVLHLSIKLLLVSHSTLSFFWQVFMK